ncbi:MAG: hypothetical protein WKH64_05395 [Chloroflexia bacterium]
MAETNPDSTKVVYVNEATAPDGHDLEASVAGIEGVEAVTLTPPSPGDEPPGRRECIGSRSHTTQRRRTRRLKRQRPSEGYTVTDLGDKGALAQDQAASCA